jgi:hypothetical protein
MACFYPSPAAKRRDYFHPPRTLSIAHNQWSSAPCRANAIDQPTAPHSATPFLRLSRYSTAPLLCCPVAPYPDAPPLRCAVAQSLPYSRTPVGSRQLLTSSGWCVSDIVTELTLHTSGKSSSSDATCLN